MLRTIKPTVHSITVQIKQANRLLNTGCIVYKKYSDTR